MSQSANTTATAAPILKPFDPRILNKDQEMSSIWTSESVVLADDGLANNFKLTESPYLKTQKKAKLRKGGLSFQYSEAELEALDAIYADKEFFADNFVQLKDGDAGWTDITLYDYQRKLLKRYTDNRWNIVMFPRQMGKTTTTIIELMHYCITNRDKNIAVISATDNTVTEVMSKLREAFSRLPFFMQPGFISFTDDGFMLDNGCILKIGIASEAVIQGMSVDFLYIDEFAYIKNSQVKKFWDNVYPSLSKNINSKIIITSTPNGRNLFYIFWKNAEAKRSRFKHYRIYWYELDRPEGNEQFKADTIANTDLSAWEMGFECSFDTQLKAIFDHATQKRLRIDQTNQQELWSKDNDFFGAKYGFECIDKSVINYNWYKDHFIIGIDIAEGLDQDSSVMKIKKIVWSVENKRLEYRSVAIYRCSDISVDDFAQLALDVSKHFDRKKIQIVVENNNFGGEFFKTIKSLIKYESEYRPCNIDMFAKFNRESKKDFELGIRWDAHNKKVAVKQLVDMVKNKKLIEDHYDSIEEYFNFGKNPNDTYAAQYGHDDLVMADVTIAYYLSTKNSYSVEFLKKTMATLREEYNDIDVEEAQRKAAQQKAKDSVYTFNNYRQRIHSEHVSDDDCDMLVYKV